MKKEEYRSLLGRLPIKSPTPQDMAMMCPHLTAEEAVTAFMTDSGSVALPPLRIRHGFQIVSYHKEWVEELKLSGIQDGQEIGSVTGTKNHPARLDWSYASRTSKSYADDKPHGDLFSAYKHMDKAMKFAEDNWGDGLILDDWHSVVEFCIQDPTDLDHKDYPRTKAVLYVTLSRDFNEVINDHSKPQSEMFDDVIAQMVIDQKVWHELKGGRGGFTELNCAHCGAGLSLSACTGCAHRFRDDPYRCGCNTPLSRKMVAFLRENGHEFKVDPEIAWKKERADWESGKREYEEMLRRHQTQK